jgi:branched-chain amino acid transport system permease protein
VPHVAHPSLLVMGAYATWMLAGYGLDPILAGLLLMPVFFLIGIGLYQFYYLSFESRGSDQGLRGIAFFFGIAFIIQVGLILAFGVDQRLVEAAYIGTSTELGEWSNGMRIPNRMLVAFGVALALTVVLTLYLSKTFTGRAIKAGCA